MKWGKILYSLFPFIIYCREGGKVGIGRVTVDKNIVKDFYHIPTYIKYNIYKVRVVDIWICGNVGFWINGCHINWYTNTRGFVYNLYLKNL